MYSSVGTFLLFYNVSLGLLDSIKSWTFKSNKKSLLIENNTVFESFSSLYKRFIKKPVSPFLFSFSPYPPPHFPFFPYLFHAHFCAPTHNEKQRKGGGDILSLPPPLATPLGGANRCYRNYSSNVVGHYLKTPFLVCNTKNNETIRSTIEALYYGHPWDQNICT